MKVLYSGTILLGVGFLMLTGAVLIWDSTAPDANIGAGILTIVGVPVGTAGLALIIGHAVHRYWVRARR